MALVKFLINIISIPISIFMIIGWVLWSILWSIWGVITISIFAYCTDYISDWWVILGFVVIGLHIYLKRKGEI